MDRLDVQFPRVLILFNQIAIVTNSRWRLPSKTTGMVERELAKLFIIFFFRYSI